LIASRIGSAVCLVWILCLVVPAPAVAADERPVSYWGPIPAPADSVTADFDDPPRPAWEYPVAGLWWVVRAPFELARAGTRATMVWLDESGTYERIRELIAPVELPYGFTATASLGQLSGLTGSLSFYHDAFLRPGNRLKLGGGIGTREARHAFAGMIVPTTTGSSLEFGVGYRLRGKARYFGPGPFSDEDDESYFTQETSWVGALYRQHLGFAGVDLVADLKYTTMRSRDPRIDDDDGDDPLDPDELSVAEAFAGRLPTGFREDCDGAGIGIGLVRDTTVEEGRPRTGTITRIKLGYFAPEDEGQADFFTYRADAEAFADLWWDRALAVRAFYSFIDSDGEAVHFQRLFTNDDPDLFRGYEDFRFRDRGITGLTLEYRYPVWDYTDPGDITLDAYTFYDAGQVFGDRRQIALDALRHSYGFGVRLSTHGGFQGRLELGVSEEETLVRLSGSQPFQHDRRNYYDGREPIPTR
jgi:outer membrane protein assembly factor BamA